ncbi:tetratricopeptide repeat-containing family protein [Tripterygium wilfordii]|uniref:Tetratricopeptide repeat-containing family protein n=1 Tax=Tripterygium wilfordii TaxID=458696 RepID=A0A7J7D625_TRIWF|nr:tetratricopeptide repeat-containing family protein [Tripterygium wilfordii]
MALLMEPGTEPKTESEIADLEAITALKESTALELKEKGNEYVKMGKKHYSDAVDCYTRAIHQKVLSEAENSLLYANRAHVNLLLGNYRRALTDAEEAIKLCSTNVKALYRATKAALALDLLTEAKSYCEKGLERDPDNFELKKLLRQIDSRKLEEEQREAEVNRAIAEAKNLHSAIEDRGLKMGMATFRELVGLRKPLLDKDKILHWPVLLLYPEVMSSDFIEDFCETDMFSAHLDMISSSFIVPPLPWDKENNYTREVIELYYEAVSGVLLSKAKVLQYLLEGTTGAQAEGIGDGEKDETETAGSQGSSKWIKVNEKRMLYDILKEPNFIITGIPDNAYTFLDAKICPLYLIDLLVSSLSAAIHAVFYVVSKRSSFYKDFRAGKWTPPL